MKKLLLRSAMLLSGLACVLSASAEKRYVQVSSALLLQEGPTYAVGAVGNNTHWSSPLFYTNNGTGTSMSARVLDNGQENTFADSQLWTFTKSDLVCHNTNPSHVAGPVFSMKSNDKYITQNVLSGGNCIPRNGTNSLDMQDTPDEYTEVEFVPYKPDNYDGSEALFMMHTGRNSSNAFFNGYRAVKYDGAFDRYSTVSDSYFYPNMADFTTYFTVYLQIASDDLDKAAKALLEYYVYEEAAKWTEHFEDRSYAEALKAALVEAAMAEVSADAFDKTFANLESETKAYVGQIVKSKVPEVLDGWLDSRIVKLQNQGSMHYMAGHPTEDIKLGTCEEITAASSWSLKKKNDGWIIKNYDQHFVTGTENIDVTYAETAAVVVKIIANDDYTVSIALASDNSKLLRSAGDDAVRAAEWSATDDAYAHWKFYGINYAVQFAARQTEKERITSLLQTYNDHHLYLEEEYATLLNELNAIDCTEPESNTEKVTKLEEVSNALASLNINMWSILDGKHIAFYFNRQNAMVAVKDDLSGIHAPNSVATENSIWQLKYVVDGKFRLYNPAAERWLAYNPNIAAVATADDAELFKITVYTPQNASHNVANNPLTLEATSVSSNKFLHKSTTANILIKYNNGDVGSALFLCRKAGELYDYAFAVSAERRRLPNTETNFAASLGAARKSIPTDAEFKELSKEQLQNANGVSYDDFANVFTVIANATESCTPEAYPFAGAFITLTSYPQNTNHIKLHYSGKTSVVGNTLTVQGLLSTDTAPDGYEDDTTEANSVWFYNGGKLVNYDNGYFIDLGKNGVSDNFLSFCTSPTDNTGAAITMVNGKNAGTSQMIVGTNCRVHVHKSGTYVVLNRCTGTTYQNENEHDFTVNLVSDLPVSIHSDGWGSFYSPITYSIPDAPGCTFFGAKIEDESLRLFELASGTKLAGGTSVLISGTAGETIHMPLNYCEEGNADYTAFGGTHVAAPHVDNAGSKTFAKTAPATAESGISAMSVTPGTVVSLSAVSDATPVHSMTLTVPTSDNDISSDGATYTLRVSDLTTTGIKTVEMNRLDGTRTIYDLQGRRLAAPVRGINIIDGRKVLVK